MNSTATVPEKLLAWYDREARRFPWRVPPGEGTPDPYQVWLSEIMLQQTTTAAAAPYFTAFTQRWPTLGDLAAASEEDIMAAWAGLGYYTRARNLVACAREASARGGFPRSEAELRALPGIGEYTAAAIAAIAFGQRAIVVDANVERVLARLFAIATPLPGARKEIRAAADTVTPDDRAGDFAQAVMDLGASICTARDPRCLLCPLSADCRGRAQGDPARLPVKAPKAPRPQREGTAFWIERDGHVWLVRRPRAGMLGGMRALPDDGWSAQTDGNGAAPIAGGWQAGGLVRHVFSHFALELGVAIFAGRAPDDPGAGEWWLIDDIERAGLPTLYTKAAALVLALR